MANIRKSFNFRNGVQVDNDNFVVNANGLVGIGTSIPTEAIDVIGNAKISGLTTTTNLGVAETANFHGDLKVGNINLDPTSGIVTAVSFYGDGSTLSNVFAIATAGWEVQGVGLHTLSRVGIGTTNPVYKLQIGSNPATGIGVGITAGNIRASGVITATTFVGSLIGNVTGTATELETARNFSVSGDVATASAVSFNGTGNVDLAVTLSNSFDANTTGIITASSFVGDLTGTATTATNLADAANITAGTISDDRLPATITSDITGNAGTATTATNLADAANITAGTISDDRLPATITSDITGTATTATNLADAANIITGTISSDRLTGSYAIDITGNAGTATTATNLSDAANITAGTISSDRLTGSYAIDITGNAGTATTATNLADGANITTGTISDDRLPAIITSDITGNAGTATTATNLADGANITTGTISSDRLTGSYAIDITGNAGTAITATNLADAANITTGTISDDRLPATITSNITGNAATATTATNLSDAANITTGTISDDRLPATITSDITGNAGTATTATNLSNAANITTGTISDDRLPASITSDITGNAATATTATNLADAANITTGTISSDRLTGSYAIDITGNAGTAAGLTGTPDVNLGVTTTGNLTAASIVGTGLSVTSIGIGTAIPANTFQQRATGNTELQVTSDTGSASVTIGREPGTAKTNTSEFRYGGGGFLYSTSESLDLINYGNGNINSYLQAGVVGLNTGSFHWHDKNDAIMSLTYEGNLGIGITNPTERLNVQGTSFFSGSVTFDDNISVNGSITSPVKGNLLDLSDEVIVDVSEKLFFGNVNISSGISTFNQVSAGSTVRTDNIVIGGNTVSRSSLSHIITGNNEQNRFYVNDSGAIGISTTVDYGLDVGINAPSKFAVLGGVGVGTTAPRCAVDFTDAGTVGIGTTQPYFLPPKISNTTRNGIGETVTGATIYNTDLNKLQVYTGSAWETLTSS